MPRRASRLGGCSPATRVRVLVCGAADRGDDGAALAAVVGLPARARALADIRFVGGCDVADLLDVGPGEPVVIVDTAVGIRAGEVVTLPLVSLTRGGRGPASSHALPIDQVLGIVEALRGAPPAGAFVGIGGQNFEPGRPFSAPVEAGLPSFTSSIAAEIERLPRGGLNGPPVRFARPCAGTRAGAP